MKLIISVVSKRNIVEAEHQIDTDNTIEPKSLPVPIASFILPERAWKITIWKVGKASESGATQE